MRLKERLRRGMGSTGLVGKMLPEAPSTGQLRAHPVCDLEVRDERDARAAPRRALPRLLSLACGMRR